MKLKITFEVDCGNILINPDIKEEVDWLHNDILKVGGTDWSIVNGEIGDDIGNENIKLVSYKVLEDKPPEGMELFCSNCDSYTTYEGKIDGTVKLAEGFTKDVAVCPHCFATSTLQDIT